MKHLPTPEYGQTYLCISIDLATASAIAGVMIDHQEPQVFNASRVPESVDASDPLRLLTQTASKEPTAQKSTAQKSTAQKSTAQPTQTRRGRPGRA